MYGIVCGNLVELEHRQQGSETATIALSLWLIITLATKPDQRQLTFHYSCARHPRNWMPELQSSSPTLHTPTKRRQSHTILRATHWAYLQFSTLPLLSVSKYPSKDDDFQSVKNGQQVLNTRHSRHRLRETISNPCLCAVLLSTCLGIVEHEWKWGTPFPPP